MQTGEAPGLSPSRATTVAPLRLPAAVGAAEHLHELAGLGYHRDRGKQRREHDLQRDTGEQARGTAETA